MSSLLIEQLATHSYKYPHRVALVVDGLSYTYGELFQQIVDEGYRDNLKSDTITSITNNGRIIDIIDTTSVVEQIILWFRSLYHGRIPIMAHRNMHVSYRAGLIHLLQSMYIPKEADFGVLTSGTTGMPKPLWRTESSWADFFEEQNRVFHIDGDTRIFVHGSFSFTGNTNMIVALLWAGGTLISSDKVQPKTWISYIQHYECTHIYMLPTKLRLLLRYSNDRLTNITHIIAGSQVVDEQLIKSLQTVCPKMEFILYYGASELNYITYCTGHEWLAHPNTVGKPFDSVHIEIVDGTIYVRTAYGICGLPEIATVGDKGYVQDGYIMFEGRSGDVINRGGYKVAILPLESKLQELSSIDEVAVLGVPDDVRGEEVLAFIVPVKGEENHVHADIQQSIPSVEQPKHIRMVSSLPLTDCSKVDKHLLKEWYNKQ